MHDQIYLDATDLSGTISEIKLEESESGTTWAFSRIAQGMLAEVQNPPDDLFDKKHFPNYRYAWRRVSGDRFEMDLGIPLSKTLTCRSVEKFAEDTRRIGTNGIKDPRYKAFDAAIGLTFLWVEKLLEKPWYGEQSLGLITPQNVLVVESDFWQEQPVRPFFVDLGFRRHGGGDPNQIKWLSPKGKFHYLSPKGDPVLSYSQPWNRGEAIACLARMIAYLLEPEIGVGRQASFERLEDLKEPAAVWSVLDRAVHGRFGDDLAAFRREFGAPLTRPSVHFASSAQLDLVTGSPARIPNTVDVVTTPVNPPRPRRWSRILSLLLALLIIAGLGYFAWQWKPSRPCDCCPELAEKSPLVEPLQKLDKLRRDHGIGVGPTPAEPVAALMAVTTGSKTPQPPTVGRQPIREPGSSFEQAKAVELDLIVAAHQAAAQWESQHPEKSLSTAEKECLQRLREEYRDFLHEHFSAAFQAKWPKPIEAAHFSQIGAEMKRLRSLGELASQSWENPLRLKLPRNAR